MPAVEPLSRLIKINPCTLSKEENALLEAELFVETCEELKEVFRKKYKNYFCLMKFSVDKENIVLENKLTYWMINDILSTDEYTMQGIACYTDTFEEVIEEIMTGKNTSPSAKFLRKLIDLHRTVRRDLYDLIIKKIIDRY